MGSRMLRGLCILLGAGALLVAPAAAAGEIDLNALTQETQKLSQKPDEMTLVWWIPEEFWAASLAQVPGMDAEQRNQFLSTVRPYTMLAVVDGKIGSMGGVTFQSEEFIRANTKLIDAAGKAYSPKGESQIDPDTRNLLAMLKPVVANTLGPLGENLHFLLFPAKNAAGEEIASPRGSGSFRVRLGDREFKWRLPLDALLAGSVCGGCGQEMKGSWRYCPWCGRKIRD